ncbi:MAG: ROK family protein [Turicibacter sp.]|nr:ROK family protein [Turicibacter sp.]
MKNYLAVDIGGTNIKWGIVNVEGAIIKKGKFKTPRQEDATAQELVSKLGEVAAQLKTEFNLEGLALSAPGAVNDKSGYIDGASALPYIHGPHIRQLVEEATGLKMHMENDANCAALAEVWKGSASDVDDALFVVIGTGIGGAVIKDRKLHTGKHLMAGEFGFMVFESDFDKGEFPNFSKLGATAQIIIRVEESKGLEPGSLTGEQVFEMAANGDAIAATSIEKFYRTVALGIFNLQHIYDPAKIIIGGAISSRDDIVERINEKLEFIVKHYDIKSLMPQVVKCTFEGDANLLGAVYHYRLSQ